jgi:hypothetical protein
MKPPEEVKRELVRKWIEKAEEDFQVCTTGDIGYTLDRLHG